MVTSGTLMLPARDLTLCRCRPSAMGPRMSQAGECLIPNGPAPSSQLGNIFLKESPGQRRLPARPPPHGLDQPEALAPVHVRALVRAPGAAAVVRRIVVLVAGGALAQAAGQAGECLMPVQRGRPTCRA